MFHSSTTLANPMTYCKADPEQLKFHVTKSSFVLSFWQVAHEIPAPDCEAFIQLGSETMCDVAEAVSAIKKAENV